MEVGSRTLPREDDLIRCLLWEPSFSCHNVPNVPLWGVLGAVPGTFGTLQGSECSLPTLLPLDTIRAILYYYTLYFALNYRKILYTGYNYTLPGTFERSAGTFGTFAGTFGTFAGTLLRCWCAGLDHVKNIQGNIQGDIRSI